MGWSFLSQKISSFAFSFPKFLEITPALDVELYNNPFYNKVDFQNRYFSLVINVKKSFWIIHWRDQPMEGLLIRALAWKWLYCLIQLRCLRLDFDFFHPAIIKLGNLASARLKTQRGRFGKLFFLSVTQTSDRDKSYINHHLIWMIPDDKNVQEKRGTRCFPSNCNTIFCS